MLNHFRLDNRVAIVTGAAGLLGRQHCHALAEAGAHVVAVDLHAAGAQAVVEALPGRPLALSGDLTDRSVTEKLRDAVLARFGRVDVLVNNAALNDKVEGHAGPARQARFENYPLEMFRRVMESNVTSAFLCSQQFAPVMAANGGGSIINIASTYALVGPDQRLYQPADGEQTFYKSAAYPTAKAALLGLTRFLAAYYGSAQVRANCLTPGGVENGQDREFVDRYEARTPMARMAAPDDYQGALLFLASDASRYMTGGNIVVDGGFTAW